MTTLKLPSTLNKLAAAYEHLLFEGELRRRFSHHMAHVASERWLAVELAMLVNERGDEFDLAGWSAIVEKGMVDVSLIPPSADPRAVPPPEAIFLELKLVGAEYWSTIWTEVRADLAGKTPKKPRADFAVCFLVNHLSHPVSRRRPITDELYKGYHAAIPREAGEFEPTPGGAKLLMLRSSAEHPLEWPRPVPSRWPAGYEASTRILWITEPGRADRLARPGANSAAGPAPAPV